jgi:adenylate cyclase
VNIAARVAALAAAGEVLVTEDTVRAAGKVESVRFIDRGRHPLKGIEQPVAIYLASAGAQETTEGLPIDPVCHMVLEPERSAGALVHQGTRYHFCSLNCAGRFAQEPSSFV